MARSLDTLTAYIASVIVLAGVAGLGVDLAQAALGAAHTAQTVTIAALPRG